MSRDDPLDESDAVELPLEDRLDLHAFAPRDVASVVDEYLTSAHERGFELVRLVHGRGTGVQRAIVQRRLATHPAVVEFWDAPESRLGATVVRLRVSISPA